MAETLRVSLEISEQETLSGTTRTLTLPNGHTATVTIPPHVSDGQELWFPGQAGPAKAGGTLILTVRLAKAGLADGPPATRDIPLPPPPDGPPVQSAHAMLPPTPPQGRQKVASTRMVVLAVAIIVLIGGSIGTLLAISTSQLNAQVSTTNQHATATAWSSAEQYASATSQALDVTATAQAGDATAQAGNATATFVANVGPDPYIASMNTVDLFDRLDGTDNQYWYTLAGCSFANGALHIVKTNLIIAGCPLPQDEIYTDFALEVQYTIIRGDAAGINFRTGSTGYGDYTIYIDNQGNCLIDRHDKSSTDPVELFKTKSTTVIAGYNKINTIGLTMQGSTITLYVNHQQVGTANDTTYASGKIGFLSASYADHADPTEVTFNNLRIWK